ncbi:MAG: alkaline phosphatase family protein [Burkholderiales bacterium]
MSSKVMMIGLDAGSLDFIEASLSSLPNLRRAVENGVRRRLRSRSSELLPAAAWPTLYTGTPPGDHGFYYPMQWDPNSMSLRPVADSLYCEPFWYELERRGHRVVALDVPETWPSRLQRGIEVTDWGAHDALSEFSARPADLAAEIRRRFGKHPIGREIPVRKTIRQLAQMRDDLIKGVRRKGELARWLLAQREWDFFIGVFGETHRAGHLFWPSPSSEGRHHPAGELLDVYRAVDEEIGRLLETVNLEDTTVIICSAHGMGANASQEHFTRKIMDRVNERFHPAGSASISQPGPRQRSLMRVLREKLPARVQHAVAQAMPVAVRNFVVDQAITGGHDWSRTPALAVLASVTGYIRFNVRGRETHGILQPGSETFTRYVRWMRECFESFRIVETGEPLVQDVVLTADAFPGDRQSYLPDAVISWNGCPPASRIHSNILGTIEGELRTGRSGNHHPDGFAIVVEHGGERGVAQPGDILDLKPMVFQRLDERRAGS